MWLFLTGCKGVEPAPTELDGLLHWMWQRYDETDDEAMAEALVNLDAAIDGASVDEPRDGTIARMTAEEAALVGVTDRDPQDAIGLYLVNAFPCEWDDLTRVLSYPQQEELYLDVYDTYARTFDAGSARDPWLAGDQLRIDYDIDYSATVLGASYTVAARGALRTIPELDDEASPFGAFLVQRSYMPTPAVYAEETDKSLDQDYQLEVYWEHGGQIVHAYGLWRQANYGTGFDSESESAQRLLLNELADWDTTTSESCATAP
ncbi:MAG: hypothetical protein ABMA64_19350 [Myxococcota bacterium]